MLAIYGEIHFTIKFSFTFPIFFYQFKILLILKKLFSLLYVWSFNLYVYIFYKKKINYLRELTTVIILVHINILKFKRILFKLWSACSNTYLLYNFSFYLFIFVFVLFCYEMMMDANFGRRKCSYPSSFFFDMSCR